MSSDNTGLLQESEEVSCKEDFSDAALFTDSCNGGKASIKDYHDKPLPRITINCLNPGSTHDSSFSGGS